MDDLGSADVLGAGLNEYTVSHYATVGVMVRQHEA